MSDCIKEDTEYTILIKVREEGLEPSKSLDTRCLIPKHSDLKSRPFGQPRVLPHTES